MKFLRTLLVAVLAASWLAVPVAAAELVMVEEKGCIWCARWNREIGPGWLNSAEGTYAGLRRIDLRAARPEDIAFAGPLVITPTFVLVVDGVEKARLEGYPGEHFFWPLINRMLREHTDYSGGTG